MARTVIPEGYDFLPDRSRDNARKALALAEERGLEADVVLTVTDGYLIPLNEGGETADASTIEGQVNGEIVSDGDEGEPIVLEAASLEDLTVPELKDAAEKAKVDLGGATKKADIIAALEGSDKIQVLAPEASADEGAEPDNKED